MHAAQVWRTTHPVGSRTGWLHDADQSRVTVEPGSGGVEDAWLWFIYNDRWQMLASWRAKAWPSDTSPKELFVNHAAGLDGLGGSSYIDDVILRDADEADSAGPAWSKVTDGTLEDRLFYLQNWRADVVVTVREAASTGDAPALVDHVRYSAYGVPWGTSMADIGAIGQTAYAFAPDGQITVDDSSLFSNAYNDNDLLADVTGIGGAADQLTPPDGQLTVDDVVAFYNAYADDGGVTMLRADFDCVNVCRMRNFDHPYSRPHPVCADCN